MAILKINSPDEVNYEKNKKADSRWKRELPEIIIKAVLGVLVGYVLAKI